ncbi:hypothetical protein XENOCAPTIV_005428 [Xenoophorus captivus]|uniref:Uncharacterized protein n=1 Tax=Xenoophorus captivus TaxID=1517983 RepID=A0ABV0Q943_9TELE
MLFYLKMMYSGYDSAWLLHHRRLGPQRAVRTVDLEWMWKERASRSSNPVCCCVTSFVSFTCFVLSSPSRSSSTLVASSWPAIRFCRSACTARTYWNLTSKASSRSSNFSRIDADILLHISCRPEHRLLVRPWAHWNGWCEYQRLQH